MTGTVHVIAGESFVLEACPACGIRFLFPNALREAALRVRDTQSKGERKLACPDGHTWHYVRPSKDERDLLTQAEITHLAERIVELEDKLAASEALVRQLGGNVTPLPLKGVVR